MIYYCCFEDRENLIKSVNYLRDILSYQIRYDARKVTNCIKIFHAYGGKFFQFVYASDSILELDPVEFIGKCDFEKIKEIAK